jgi:tRNA nucleotidyltransferase/poly(A) polymerase
VSEAASLLAAWRKLLADDRVATIAVAAEGVAVHLVGGAVRDAGLHRPVHDLDVIVAAAGPAIAARLAAATGARLVALGGDRFGALRLVSGDRHIDLWDLQGGALLADLWRRDFTVNAIALALADGSVVDPCGGAADLARRRLRATRAAVFAEDPVRVLRLARLATTLPGFEADPETVGWARASTPELAAMPHERLRVELEILFDQPRVAAAADWCDALDLPTFLFGKGAVLADASSTTLRAAKKLDEWRASRSAEGPAAPPASTGAAGALLALHWSLFTELFSSSQPAWEAPAPAIERRRWLHAAGPSWRDALALRAALAANAAELERWRRCEAEILAWPTPERDWIVSPPALLSGEEVQSLLGIPPGPAVGAALARVRRAQVQGVVRLREEAEALLRAGEPGA